MYNEKFVYKVGIWLGGIILWKGKEALIMVGGWVSEYVHIRV